MIHLALLLWVRFTGCLAVGVGRDRGVVFSRPRTSGTSRILHVRELGGDTALSLALIVSILHLRIGSREVLDMDVVLDLPSHRSSALCRVQTVGALRVRQWLFES